MAKVASPKKNNQTKPITGRGGYRPGSGRPKGVPNKATAEIKAIAQPHTPEAIQTLLEIMRESENDSARVSAVKEVLDRAWGKSRQAIEHSGEMSHTVQTKEQRDAAVEAFLRADG